MSQVAVIQPPGRQFIERRDPTLSGSVPRSASSANLVFEIMPAESAPRVVPEDLRRVMLSGLQTPRKPCKSQ
jgi:hypothetical protein